MIETAEDFIRLRTSSDKSEYLRAANDSADIKVWLDIILKYPDMKKWVAHNKTIPEKIIRMLAKDKDNNVRLMIAHKRKTPSDILMDLAKDKDESVRMAVAKNKKTSKEILLYLKNDSWEQIVDVVITRFKSL